MCYRPARVVRPWGDNYWLSVSVREGLGCINEVGRRRLGSSSEGVWAGRPLVFDVGGRGLHEGWGFKFNV